MITLKTEQSQEETKSRRFLFTKHISESKLRMQTDQEEIHVPSKFFRDARKLVLPQIQHEQQIPLIQCSPQQQSVEYIKLPEIDEKFFIKKTYNDEFSRPKIHFHSHQASREEQEFVNSEKQIQQSILNQKKVEFQDDVLVIDYINQTYKKSNIDGSSKPLKLKRQQTRKLSDDILLKEKTQQNIFKSSAKSHFFDEQTKEIKTQRNKIANIINQPFQF